MTPRRGRLDEGANAQTSHYPLPRPAQSNTRVEIPDTWVVLIDRFRLSSLAALSSSPRRCVQVCSEDTRGAYRSVARQVD
jgi:hypothetical protein